jgi:hypothetical protein
VDALVDASLYGYKADTASANGSNPQVCANSRAREREIDMKRACTRESFLRGVNRVRKSNAGRWANGTQGRQSEARHFRADATEDYAAYIKERNRTLFEKLLLTQQDKGILPAYAVDPLHPYLKSGLFLSSKAKA